MNLKIVSVDQIPLAGPVPLDNLEEVYKVCLELKNLCEMHEGVGISAVQAGIPWNLFLVKADCYSSFDVCDTYGYFINCEYTPVGENKIDSIEGCLSLLHENGNLRFYKLQRWAKIKVTGKKLKKNKDLILTDFSIELTKTNQGVVFQHEIDHQNGILIDSFGKEI